MSRIRVLVVDDHAIVRDGLVSLLSRRKDIEVVGQASDGRQAVEQAVALSPDVILMDIAMPEMNGLEATVEIQKRCPDSRVLVLTQYESIEYVLPLLQAGAAGYLAKRARSDELVSAIRHVFEEGAFLPPNVLHSVLKGMMQTDASGGASVLTEREKQVVRLVADGLSSREIAEQLCLSVKTVDTHRANILEKIGAHSSAELIKYAIREGIIRP